MSLIACETLSSQHTGMLSPPKSPNREPSINQRPYVSDTTQYRRKEVVEGDVVRTYESRRRRRQSSQAGAAMYRQENSQLAIGDREKALQAAMELPSSVIIVQGLRRLMNSDEPLYDDLKKEQKMQLQREFLKEVGTVEYDCDMAQRPKGSLPLSPPTTPKPKYTVPIKAGAADEGRFCECCRTHCV